MANVVKNIMSPGHSNLPASFGLLVLRFCAGGTMAWLAGYPKLMLYNAQAATFPDWLGLGHEISMAAAIFIELVCGALIAMGAATRFATGCMIFYLAMQVFGGNFDWVIHQARVLELAAFITLLFAGAGKLSCDEYLTRSK